MIKTYSETFYEVMYPSGNGKFDARYYTIEEAVKGREDGVRREKEYFEEMHIDRKPVNYVIVETNYSKTYDDETHNFISSTHTEKVLDV